MNIQNISHTIIPIHIDFNTEFLINTLLHSEPIFHYHVEYAMKYGNGKRRPSGKQSVEYKKLLLSTIVDLAHLTIQKNVKDSLQSPFYLIYGYYPFGRMYYVEDDNFIRDSIKSKTPYIPLHFRDDGQKIHNLKLKNNILFSE